MNLNHELHALKEAFSQTKIGKINREFIIKEFITNGVAGLISILITTFVHNFFIPKDWKNLDNAKELIKHNWRTRIKHQDDNVTVLDSTTYELLNWTIIFVVGLIVFTLVENFMEKYLEIRKNKT